MTEDWWEQMLAEYRQDGRRDADLGDFDPPHPACSFYLDPQDEAENTAYKQGFDSRRKQLGDKFRWST